MLPVQGHSREHAHNIDLTDTNKNTRLFTLKPHTFLPVFTVKTKFRLSGNTLKKKNLDIILYICALSNTKYSDQNTTNS